MGRFFSLVSSFVEQEQWLPLTDIVGIQWGDVCDAAWATWGRALTLLSGLTTVSFSLHQEQPLRPWAVP